MTVRLPSPARSSAGRSPAPRGTRRWRGALLAGVLVVTLAACGDSGDGDAAPGGTVETEIGDAATVESAPSTAAPTTAADTTAPETTAPAPTGAPDPEAAAAGLYGAWKAGDRTAAAAVAETAAVDGMFAAAPGDYSLYNRCNTGEFGQSSCLYRGDPGTIQLSMRQREGGWVVTSAVFSPA